MTQEEWLVFGLRDPRKFSYYDDYSRRLYERFEINEANQVLAVWVGFPANTNEFGGHDILGQFQTPEAAQVAVVALTLANPR